MRPMIALGRLRQSAPSLLPKRRKGGREEGRRKCYRKGKKEEGGEKREGKGGKGHPHFMLP